MSETNSQGARKAGDEQRRRGRPSVERSAAITAEILHVAGAMFLREGYEGTSMEAIASCAGVPKTTLYKRFADKQELLRAVIDDQMRQWSSIRSRDNSQLSDDLGERLRYHTRTLLEWTSKPEVRAISRLMSNLPEGPDTGFAGPANWGYRKMLGVLVEAIRSTGPAAGIDARNPEALAATIMAIVAGQVAVRTTREPLTIEESNGTANYIVDLLLRGKSAW